MSYSRITTFSDGTAVTAAQIEGNFKELRDWETEDITVGNVQVISADKIKKPEIVYMSGSAQLTINSTGCIAKAHNPALNFRREKPRNVSLSYNGCIAQLLHFKRNVLNTANSFGREIPKTGILFYMEEAGSVRVTYNIMMNIYAEAGVSSGWFLDVTNSFLFLTCYPHDEGQHNQPVTPNPNVDGRAVVPTTVSVPSTGEVNGDNIAGLRCVTIHKCFNNGSGSSMLAKGWYSAALFAASPVRFSMVGANTVTVEAHYGIHVTVTDGVSI
tara:strand:+ start:125 stop:937 length:813 start_codon:yes stop_codon:yes gene_type:complete